MRIIISPSYYLYIVTSQSLEERTRAWIDRQKEKEKAPSTCDEKGQPSVTNRDQQFDTWLLRNIEKILSANKASKKSKKRSIHLHKIVLHIFSI
jgi:hypothetical protein